jgi:hypothetical protein
MSGSSETSCSALTVHDQILRQHFGLEATFSDTRADKPDSANWPKNKNIRWHDEDNLETTICHLTLPRQKPEKTEWTSSDLEDALRTYQILGTQTLAIDTHCHVNTTEIVRRFQKAMKYLDLAPFPHPSQSYCTLRPALEPPAAQAPTGAAISEKEENLNAQRKDPMKAVRMSCADHH